MFIIKLRSKAPSERFIVDIRNSLLNLNNFYVFLLITNSVFIATQCKKKKFFFLAIMPCHCPVIVIYYNISIKLSEWFSNDFFLADFCQVFGIEFSLQFLSLSFLCHYVIYFPRLSNAWISSSDILSISLTYYFDGQIKYLRSSALKNA